MDTIQILPYLPIALSILTFVCAWAVIPYLLNSYNTDWLPAWLHPDSEAVDSTYRCHYPADEARWMLAASFFITFVYIIVPLYIGKYECIFVGVPYLFALIPATYLLHRVNTKFIFPNFAPFIFLRLRQKKYSLINIYFKK